MSNSSTAKVINKILTKYEKISKHYLQCKIYFSSKNAQLVQQKQKPASHPAPKAVCQDCSQVPSGESNPWNVPILAPRCYFLPLNLYAQHRSLPYLAAKPITVRKQCLLCQNREWIVSQRHSSCAGSGLFPPPPFKAIQLGWERMEWNHKSILVWALTTPSSMTVIIIKMEAKL